MLKMKSAKSYKILILFVIMVSFLISGFCLMGKTSALAENTTDVYRPGYVSVYDGDEKLSEAVKYSNNNIVASVKAGQSVKLANKLVLEQSSAGELEFVVNAPVDSKIILKVTATSLGENGNFKIVDNQDKFDKQIVSEFSFVGDGLDKVLLLGAQDNVITVNGAKVSADDYFKIELIDNKAPVNVEFFVEETANNQSVDFSIISIDQKASDAQENYKQTFELTGKDLTKTARPRALLAKKSYAKTADGYELTKVDGVGYDMSPTKYSITSASGAVELVALSAKEYGAGENDKSITFTVESSKNYITFHKASNGVNDAKDFAFGVSWKNGDGNVVIEEFNDVNVIAISENLAPYYDNAAEDSIQNPGKKVLSSKLLSQLETYQMVLQNSTIKNGASLVLGEKFDVPSMGNFFFDDTTAYSDSTNLTKTFNYITPSSENKNTTSTKSISIDETGDYKLYLTASEKTAGGETLKMESDVFYDVAREMFFVKGDNGFEAVDLYDDKVQEALLNNADSNFVIFMFTFSINDDADLSVEAQDQDNGFTGIEYKATKFNIVASGSSTNYKLYYNANVNAGESDAGWVEIVAKKNAPKEGANGYSYDELVSIAYDGSLTFTPNKIGSYKIVCELTSNKSYKTASDTAVIRIVAEPTIVEPANYWFEDNLASIIFLGVGVLCLIAIVVLLCIKPKNKAEDDE